MFATLVPPPIYRWHCTTRRVNADAIEQILSELSLIDQHEILMGGAVGCDTTFSSVDYGITIITPCH